MKRQFPMKRQRTTRVLPAASEVALALLGARNLWAGVNDLRITEVNPSTGQVEVTHMGVGQFTATSSLPFCHRFNYASAIPANTTFGSGESKVFTVAGLNPADSDLWLYRDGNIGSAASIITGMKYGPAANVGRTALAVSVGLWPAANAFVPAPAIGQSLRPMNVEATRTTGWFSGTPDFGSFSPAQIRILRLTESGSVRVLEFSSPLPGNTHRLESRASLSPDGAWMAFNSTLSNTAPENFQLTIPQSTHTNEFFRITGP